ncbi:hypothetical protein Tco_0470959 [Tanacetum coccineum]
MEITATIDGRVKTITEASIRRHLKLEDSDSISTLPNNEIFEQLDLMGVHSLRSDEGSMTLHELMVLCTTLSKKVESLESDLKQTKLTYGAAYTKLIMKVKKLENRIKSRRTRRRVRLIVSEDEDDIEDPSKQGRRIAQLDEDEGITLIKELFKTTMKRVKDFVPIESDRLVPMISTGSSKRTAETELEHEGSKRQKTNEEQSAEEEKELSEEELQKLIMIVPVEEVYVEALQRLFEPDIDYILWKLQRYMHDPLTWRIMDNTRAQQKALDDVNTFEIHLMIDTSIYMRGDEGFLESLSPDIIPSISFQIFEEPPLEEEILSFIRDLGHTGEIKFLSDVNVQSCINYGDRYAAIINKTNDMYYIWTHQVIVGIFIGKGSGKYQGETDVLALLPGDVFMFTTNKSYKTYLAYAMKTASTAKGQRLQTSSKGGGLKPGKKKQPERHSKAIKVPTVLSEVAKSSDEEDDDEVGFNDDDDDNDDDEDNDDDDDDDDADNQDDDDQEDDDQKVRHNEEESYEESDEESDEEIKGAECFEEEELDEEETNDEDEANELYRDVCHRLKTLENDFSEFNQTNQFAAAVASIPDIVDTYLANKMNEGVKIADQVKEQVKAQVSKILPKIEKTINEQLKADVLTRSSNKSKTSYVVAANLSELELKKILIDKMESNKRRDDEDKDEEPSAGSNRGSKRRRAGKKTRVNRCTKEKRPPDNWPGLLKGPILITRLRIQDIKDVLLLLGQGKLTNLTVEERLAFNVSLSNVYKKRSSKGGGRSFN